MDLYELVDGFSVKWIDLYLVEGKVGYMFYRKIAYIKAIFSKCSDESTVLIDDWCIYSGEI